MTESERLQVQIQAYLDNIFDVNSLLEDTENKHEMLEHVDDLQAHLAHVSYEWKDGAICMVKGLFYVLSNLSGVQLTEKLQQTENEYMRRVAELEKHLDQNRKELNAVKVWGFWWGLPTQN